MNRISPDWKVDGVSAFFTTRQGGVSKPPYNSLNLGRHVGDAPGDVDHNRSLLDLPGEPQWLNQVHSNHCIEIDRCDGREGDAAFTQEKGAVLAVMTADCLPILVASGEGEFVGVIHAGWRGLASGVIKSAIRAMPASDLHVWFGPAIGPCHYEVGNDVRSKFGETGILKKGGKWTLDLYAVAREQLHAEGVSKISGGDYCTYCDEGRFFSHRRDGVTGRMAGFIWKV